LIIFTRRETTKARATSLFSPPGKSATIGQEPGYAVTSDSAGC
jgi:hypothetical protein